MTATPQPHGLTKHAECLLTAINFAQLLELFKGFYGGAAWGLAAQYPEEFS